MNVVVGVNCCNGNSTGRLLYGTNLVTILFTNFEKF